ncbi:MULTISPECIES: DUF1996 domain-containing protein [Streptomyces]|uniref:DUF1996 domain-containing protein n=1 Tax=Streptomyces TaxID=1883 RepID=UPI000241B5D9|nr:MULTISPECIES: DUF1996 domain-containing protein [Streptomyces]EHM26375.1 hypothetical protein SPW_5227 [Streptomyces sp. W007]MCX4517840.1 DUF1996 domain-containing protein [Streptomyces anulatus]MCX4600671.1 DUF1996 domain-containing protein [Streptomyces anulatus]WTD28478.1 DUF1996 domain-containing protein [Streptomyces anulatus]
MRRTSRKKRSTLTNRAIAASAALILGGGGLVAVNVYASAGEGPSGSPPTRTQNAGRQLSTIDCPEAVNGLPEVPDPARGEVDRELAAMDTQITDAYRQFADRKEQLARDPGLAENAVLGPLRGKRAASLDRIGIAIGRVAERPEGLASLAGCSLRADDDQGQDPGQGQGQNAGQGQDPGDQDPGQGEDPGQGQGGNGPEAADFVDIRSVRPDADRPRKRRGASRGSFTTDCGRNENGKFNPDNVIVAPGVSNGAHHMHDYVGNQANDAFASDDDLVAGATTCRNQGDRSTYYWPVLRLQNGQDEDDVDADGGGRDQNTGEIRTPSRVTLRFVGSPVGRVTAMPRFLRIITGDAKAFTNGDANANASWSCTGFEDRQLRDKYPICPEGSQVVRTFAFQSCWDGQNTDSANHRTHVAFAQDDGRCPSGFRAVPQLVQRIVYDVPPGPGFAVDSFPEQLHKPITDHGDFINVFDERLMKNMVRCINDGRRCR